MSFVLLFVTLAVAFPVAIAEEENLIANGNFEEYEGNVPANWVLDLKENTTAEIVEDVEIADGVTANAIKFSTTADSSNRSDFYYTKTVAIEKNAKYTTTFWVKASNMLGSGFRTYMYEPNYVKNGEQKSNMKAQEGENIYSFTYDSGSTRVIRTDISHSWTIAETGKVIDAVGPSMFISRYGGAVKIPTLDYPEQERQGEWFQIIHTFETGNYAAHEADISYQFSVPEAVNGELWIADVKMTVEKSDIIDFYTPTVNDVTLGCISPAGAVPIYDGVETILTAEPFGENIFDGWYDGDTLVSTEPEISFMYEAGVTPVYEARFEKGEFGIDGSYEDSEAEVKVANDPKAATSEWTEELFKEGSYDGIHFVDSNNAGTWRQASISNAFPMTGEYSLKFNGIWGSVGRKFTGLSKNSNYTISFYAQSILEGSGVDAYINGIFVTDSDHSFIMSNNGTLSNRPANDASVLYRDTTKYDTVGKWNKISATFNTGNNTDVILWINSSSAGANLYLDNFAIARGEINYTPEVNDAKLGFANTVSARDGEDITIIATPFGEAIFSGWYVDDELVSKDAEYTFTYSSANPPTYVAHFEAGEFMYDGGYETGYTVDSVVAQEVKITAATWTEDAFLASSKDDGEHFIVSTYGNDWRKVTVTNSRSHTGEKSLRVAGQYGYVGKKIAGLQKNTDYIVSFYSYLTYTQSDTDTPGVSGVMVTEPNTEATLLSNGTISVRSVANAGVLAKDTENYADMFDDWAKREIAFNTGDNEEVILWIQPTGKDAVLYLDDFAVARAVTIDTELSRLGTVELNSNKVSYNAVVTIKAIPYEGNTFIGWYEGDELVSSDANYTFIANGNKHFTPKFSGENAPDYEYFAGEGQDGTFENGTIAGWEFSDPSYSSDWCNANRGTTEAYEGRYSLEFFARHRNSVLKLTNLHAHTRYTLSFYFKLNEVGEKEALSVCAITPTDVIHVEAGKTLIATTEAIPFTGEWQKYEISFNSGNYSEVNFILRYATESVSAKFYIDNMKLMVGQYEEHKYDNACDTDCNYCGEIREVPDHVYDNDKDLECNECGFERAPLFTPGNINGDDADSVDLQDVVALAQIVAGWSDVQHVTEALDVNGDSSIDLQDVVLLAQFVAGWDVELSDTAYIS